MGVGHVMRCLTLSDRLRERGGETRFVCRTQDGHLNDLLRSREIPVAELPVPGGYSGTSRMEDYQAWLGVTQEVDASQTIEALGHAKADWLVVDHYGLDATWERQIRPHVSRLMAISDFEGRTHDCDVLLDQNYSDRGSDRYGDQVSKGCRRLLGPHYALLRSEFVTCRPSSGDHEGRVRRLFLFFGGTDQDNVTGRAMKALADPDFAELEIDVVVGANNAWASELEADAATRPGATIHRSVTQMADLMSRADLAIGAGGGTTWERLCLGVPSIVVSIAENQVPACRALARDGMIQYLGDQSNVTASAIGDAVRRCIAAPDELIDASARGRALVDGLGAGRVVESLDSTPVSALRLRPAESRDASLYFSWVNDPEARRQSLNSKPIDWQRHSVWFSSRLASAECRLLLMEAGELPVGQIRFDRVGAETTVDYSIDPAFRGRGWAQRLLALGIEQIRGGPATVLRAEVKEGNPASIAAFMASGFDESHADRIDGTRVFRMQL